MLGHLRRLRGPSKRGMISVGFVRTQYALCPGRWHWQLYTEPHLTATGAMTAQRACGVRLCKGDRASLESVESRHLIGFIRRFTRRTDLVCLNFCI